MAKGATAKALDFTNVKDAGNFNPKHQAPGDYRGTIVSVADAKSKTDGKPMWLYTIKVGSGTYPFYCKLEENQLWKIRNLFTAAGVNIPKKRVNVDPNKVTSRDIGVTLEDDEYEGKMKSVIASTFPTSELTEGTEEDDDEDAEDETPPSSVKTKEKKGKKEKSVEAPQKGKKDKGKKAKLADDVSDDELEELDIEDI